MKKKVYEYFKKRLKEENIYLLEGHYPKLKDEIEVEKWIYIIKRAFIDFFEEKGGEEDE